MARRRGRLTRLAAVLAVLILSGLAAVHLPAVRQRVLDYTQAYAEREFGLRLRASSLRYNLLTLSVELRDLSVTAVSAEEAFLHVDRALVELGPGILLGRPQITRVTLNRPQLLVVRREDGTTNLPQPSPSASGPQPTSPLRLGVVSAAGFSARLDDRAGRRSATLGPFDFAVDTRGTPGALGPSAFAVRAGGLETSGTIAGRLTFDGARVRFEHLTADTTQGHLVLDGWADVIGERPAMSSKVSATIDLPQAARLARVDARNLSGRLDAVIDIDGPLAAPAITLQVTSRDVIYAPLGPVRFAGRSSLKGDGARIDTLDIESTAGSLHADGTMGGASRLALRWANLHLDDLVRDFGPALLLRSGSTADGSAVIEFDRQDLETRAWSRLRAEATTTLQPVARLSSPETLDLSGTVALQLDRGRWSLRHSVRVARGGADLDGVVNGRLADGGPALAATVGGRSRATLPDIGALPPLLAAARVPLRRDVADGLHGSLHATIDLDGTIERPRAEIGLTIRDLQARTVPRAADLDGRLSVDRGGLRASRVRMTAGTSVLQGSGQYRWDGPLDARFELIQGDLAEIADRFLPVTVNGSARLEGTLSGTARAAHGTLALTARDLAVDQVSVGSLNATGTLDFADGGVMKLEAGAPALGAHAIVEILNRTGYPVSGEISVDHHDIGAMVPPRYRERIGDLSGRLRATARGSGLLTNPAGIRGRVEIGALDATWRGTPVILASPGSIGVEHDRIAIDTLDLRVGQHIRASLAGQLGVAELPDALRLKVDASLAELVDITSRTSGTQPTIVRGDGTVALDLLVRGTIGHPLPAGTLTMRSPSLGYGTMPPVTDLTLEASIDPTTITLRTGAAQWQQSSVTGEGVLPWRVLLDSWPYLSGWRQSLSPEPGRARLTLRADNVTHAVLNGLVTPERLRDVQGRLSATVAIDTERLALEAVSAHATFDRASLTLAGIQFAQTVPTRLALEQGQARIEDFRWSAEGNPLVATGGMRLTQPASIDVGLSGVLNLRALGAFLPDVQVGGRAETDFKVTGRLDDPDVVGRIHVSDGEARWDSPRIAVADLEGIVEVNTGRKVSVAMVGSINTGNATLDGNVDLGDPTRPTGSLKLNGQSVVLEFPPGLQTESNADLTLALDGPRSALSGRIDVLGGTYREPLVLSSQLLRLSGTNGVVATRAPEDWLSHLALDVAVATSRDVRIDNNYGRLDVGATLRVTGTVASPGALGRLEAADEGEIYLGGNTYRIERLTIGLTNPRAIVPDVNFSAQTRIGQLPIGITLACPAARPCERKVTSLAAGVDDKEAEAQLLGVTGTTGAAGEALARLLSGELLGVVGRTVGLDVLRLDQTAARPDIFDDPTLIAGDVDPAARLTLAKRVGSNVELVFSQNLADNGFTWSTTYTGPYGMSGRLLILDDQSRAYEFRHEPPIGASRTRRPPQPPGPRITDVRIVGTPGFPEGEVRRQLRLARGDRFTFGAWQRDQDRLEHFYRDQDFLEARVRARRQGQPADDSVVLEYAIARGPRTQLTVRGASLPDAVRQAIVSRWASALFDGFLERDARAIVRAHLYRLGHLQAAVTAAVTADASRDLKTLTIDVVPGPVVAARVEVTGNAAVSTEDLQNLINKDALAAWLDPASAGRLIENRYHSEGFLDAHASVAAPEDRRGTSVVVITVTEGTAYAIGTIEVTGLPPDAESGTRDALGLSAGTRYQPASVAAAVDTLEARMRRAAYRQSSIDVGTRVDAKAARVDVSFRVTPGPRSILRDVVVAGGDATKPVVARSIVLETGAPLDVAAIAETRRRLEALDVYRSVDVEVQPAASGAPPSADAGDQPVIATITLQERPRYRLRYGLAINDEQVGTDERRQEPGFAADLDNRNVLGRGISAGLSLRLRQDQQVGRFSVGAKRFFGLPIRSTVFVEKEREQINPDAASPTTSNISTLATEQAYQFARGTELRYGYGFERNHTFIRSADSDPFDVRVNIARFTTSGLVDRRDDAFNPARGWFASSALELSAQGIGSDLRFLKDFAQYSQFVPIHRGVVLASAVRLGLARTPGDEVLIPSERFYAGGANSVRGYREDDLGARSVLGDAEGGSALLVLNGELRFVVFKRLHGVGFVDAGNVYPKISDLSLSDLQVGAGAGARLDTPFGLIRFDVAVPVNGRPTDPRWRFHFGIGHAF